MYNKILVTGQTRSGTTFLANFLNAQKGITIYSDIFHILAGKMLGRTVRTKVIDYDKKLSNSEKNNFLKLINVGLDMQRRAGTTDYSLGVRPSDFNTARELYGLLLNSIAKEKDKNVGHKVTEVEVNLENLLNNMDMKVIYIVRDPRDQIISANEKFGSTVFQGISGWNNAINTVLNIESDKLLIVKFEDLILKDSNLKDRLGEFLDTEITYNIRKVKQQERDFISNSSFTDIKKVFDPRAVNRWKSKDEFKIKYIYMRLKQIIDKLGYEQISLTSQDIRYKERLERLLIENQELMAQIENNKLLINKILSI